VLESSSNQYFATLPPDELAPWLRDYCSRFRMKMSQIGIASRMQESEQYYNGLHFKNIFGGNTSFIGASGSQGQLKLLAINHYRNLLQHILIMTTNQKPAWDVRAISSDPDSLASAKLGSTLLDSYMSKKRLARYLKATAEQALVYSKGFLYARWDDFLGKGVGVEPVQLPDGRTAQRIAYEGDVSISSPTPWDVYYDFTYDDFKRVPWMMAVVYENKWDLKARFPDRSEKIDNLPTKYAFESQMLGFSRMQQIQESDLVATFHFYHLRTDAVPAGRFFYGGPGCTLVDRDLPYGEDRGKLPFFRMVPGEVFGTTEGYTTGFDLLSINKAYNVIISAIFTNQQAHAVSKILIPTMGNISVEQLGEGLAAIKYNPGAPGGGEPKPLNLLGTPEECFKFLDLCNSLAETLSGVNSVARGNPESSLKSGVALGLVQSMAIQYASGLQQSWAELQEDTGSFLLCDLLAKHANNERVVELAGKRQGGQVKYTKEGLQGISGVSVELANPLMRTSSGKMEIADKLSDKGYLKDARAYIEVLETGNLDQATQDDHQIRDFILWENEELMEGRDVKALVGEPHLEHARNHFVVTQNPNLRRAAASGDPEAAGIISRALAHIQEHIELAQSQPPIWAVIAGEAPMGPPEAPPMPPPEAGPSTVPPPPAPGAVPPETPLPANAQVPVQ